MHKSLLAAFLAILCACSPNAARDDTPARLIVRWHADESSLASRLDEMTQTLGVRVQYVREMSGDAHVIRILDPIDAAALDAALQRLNALPQVRYATIEARRVAH